MKLAALFLLIFAAAAPVQASSQHPPAGSPAQTCLHAARGTLGPDAAVLKCGHLTGAAALEIVAAIQLRSLRRTGAGVPVREVAVLLKETLGWREVFVADAHSMRNDLGYVEENAEVPGTSSGFRVTFSDRPEDAPGAGFTLWLTFLSPGGRDEGVPVQISWNPAVKRFQEYSYYAGEGFQPEIKTAPRAHH